MRLKVAALFSLMAAMICLSGCAGSSAEHRAERRQIDAHMTERIEAIHAEYDEKIAHAVTDDERREIMDQRIENLNKAFSEYRMRIVESFAAQRRGDDPG